MSYRLGTVNDFHWGFKPVLSYSKPHTFSTSLGEEKERKNACNPIRTGLKIIILKSKPRIPLIYKKIESPFLTFRTEQMTYIAHEESSFSVQTKSYVFQ